MKPICRLAILYHFSHVGARFIAPVGIGGNPSCPTLAVVLVPKESDGEAGTGVPHLPIVLPYAEKQFRSGGRERQGLEAIRIDDDILLVDRGRHELETVPPDDRL